MKSFQQKLADEINKQIDGETPENAALLRAQVLKDKIRHVLSHSQLMPTFGKDLNYLASIYEDIDKLTNVINPESKERFFLVSTICEQRVHHTYVAFQSGVFNGELACKLIAERNGLKNIAIVNVFELSEEDYTESVKFKSENNGN